MKPNQAWVLPVLMFIQSMFLGSTFMTRTATISGFVLASVFAYVSSAISGREETDSPKGIWESTRRARIFITYFLVSLATIGWRFLSHSSETINPVAFSVDSVAHLALACGLIVFALNPKYGHPSLLGLGMLVVMLSVAAGGASHSIGGQISVALLATVTYLFMSRFILNHRFQRKTRDFHRLGQASSATHADDRDRRRIGLLFSLATVSIIVVATSAVARTTHDVLPDLQRIVYDKLKSSFDTVRQDVSVSNSQYVRGGRLGSVSRHMTASPDEVAIKVYADSAPGYLRGSVFDWYTNGQWNEYTNDRLPSRARIDSYEPRTVYPSGDGRTRMQGLRRKLTRFDLYKVGKDSPKTIEIQNDPAKGHVFFSPLNIRWVEARANSIDISSHDIIEHGINTGVPYIIGLTNERRIETIDDRRLDVLLYVAPGMSELISGIADDLCRNRTTSQAKAEAISHYFQTQYTYSLKGNAVPGRVDPLVHFLETKHSAHCEYFATATVLMLRSQNIPARYVTGYVATEFDDEDDYWMARNRDAHAWAEAYDDVTQTWFPVESTPGRAYQSITFSGDQSNTLSDQIKYLEKENSDSQSYISKIIGYVFSMRATDPVTFLIRFGQIPLLIITVLAAFYWMRRSNKGDTDSDDARSHRMLQRVDRMLRKHTLVRDRHETLHQFADRIQARSEGPDDQQASLLEQYANWYRAFAEARYRGRMPSPFETA